MGGRCKSKAFQFLAADQVPAWKNYICVYIYIHIYFCVSFFDVHHASTCMMSHVIGIIYIYIWYIVTCLLNISNNDVFVTIFCLPNAPPFAQYVLMLNRETCWWVPRTQPWPSPRWRVHGLDPHPKGGGGWQLMGGFFTMENASFDLKRDHPTINFQGIWDMLVFGGGGNGYLPWN